MVHKAVHGAKHWKRHKMLTPKQVPHGLPISLAQVKVGNNLKTYKMKFVK